MKFDSKIFRSRKQLSAYLLAWISLCIPLAIQAQQPAGAGTSTTSVPDSPKPQGTTPATVDTTNKFIGYMTNKSFVFPDIAFSEGPMSTGEKFRLFVNQSISPPYILAAGVSAAYSQARDTPESVGQGWDAYGRRFGDSLARASSNSFFSSFVFASLFHQDPRFYPQSHPSLWGSVKYSAVRVFVTRTDSGRDTFNSSGIFGTMAAEGLANSYLPTSEQTVGKNFERIGTDLAWKFAGNMFKNYWPTLFRDMGLNRLKVIPDPGSPDHPSPQN
jgi:hypothetical protein